jgi:hypothetical protein
MTTKTTYEKLFTFSHIAQAWLNAGKDRVNTKLGYAITRLAPRLQKLERKYQNAIADIQIDCCEVDERGIILKDERGEFRFTKVGLKDRNRKQLELLEAEIEIEPYYASQAPDDLSESEREAFEGFVLKVEADAAKG